MSDAPAPAPRKLAHLALTAIARSWHPGVPLSLGDRVLPVEVAKLLWAELKARAVKAGAQIKLHGFQICRTSIIRIRLTG